MGNGIIDITKAEEMLVLLIKNLMPPNVLHLTTKNSKNN
jgi:hypothetical protein